MIEITGFLTRKRFKNYAYNARANIVYNRYHIRIPVKDKDLLNQLPKSRFECIVEIPKVTTIKTKCFKSPRSIYAYIPSKYASLIEYLLKKSSKMKIVIKSLASPTNEIETNH
ncbi:MAG: hypothetical protein DRH17_13895 [Deltaproteobacteria bacterium]|nr:MAG: hypothetical protein DRH17_13895 [Deltaproteobacteria bacterium]